MNGLETLLEQRPSPNRTMMEHRMADTIHKTWRRGKAIPANIADFLDYSPETGVFIWRERAAAMQFNDQHAGSVAGSRLTGSWGKSYTRIRVNGVRYLAHRLAWVISHGPIPEGMEIDHINGNGEDNRLSNLRLVSTSENKKNTRLPANNRSGRIGVTLRKNGTYYARGTHGYHIGSYATFEEAAAARSEWERANSFHENHGSGRPL